MTSSAETYLMTGMLTLFLYQVILGRDDPVAEEVDPDCCYDT